MGGGELMGAGNSDDWWRLPSGCGARGGLQHNSTLCCTPGLLPIQPVPIFPCRRNGKPTSLGCFDHEEEVGAASPPAAASVPFARSHHCWKHVAAGAFWLGGVTRWPVALAPHLAIFLTSTAPATTSRCAGGPRLRQDDAVVRAAQRGGRQGRHHQLRPLGCAPRCACCGCHDFSLAVGA